VEKGLETEKKGRKRAHARRYIQKMLFQIEQILFLRNDWIRQSLAKRDGTAAPFGQAGQPDSP